ncbi:hypothetical protein WJX72_001336 [[Myrmecia] bisecta]|uniref:Tubulin/FtsZ GTPase domain-containing protein n=1 Tax=[Myrmecia] bisecta TaxID=41462 RepID=A0AAW1Q9W4_9CHLO
MPPAREVISVHAGQCGAQLGGKFWEILCNEDRLGDSFGRTGDTSFGEQASGAYVPRAVFADITPASLDCLRAGPYGQVYRPENLVFSPHTSTFGENLHQEGLGGHEHAVYGAIRKEAERCESLQGFQLCHGLGGTTGSRLTSALLARIRDEYPKSSVLTRAPLLPCRHAALDYHHATAQELCEQMCSVDTLLCTADPARARCLAAAAVFRGASWHLHELEEQIVRMRDKSSSSYMPSMPANVKSWWCEWPPSQVKASATLIANSTAIQSVFRRVLEQLRSAKAEGHRHARPDETDGGEADMMKLLSVYEALDALPAADVL